MIEADLHLHTTFSDGTLTPTQIVALCAERGLKTICISDHDTTNGLPEAFEAASAYPRMTVIPGIELSTDVPGSEIHILGYFVDHADASLQAVLEEFRSGREDRGEKMVGKLNGMGLAISWERVQQIAGDASIGRPHIAQALVEAGYVKYPRDAFDKYLGRNGSAYVERPKLLPEDAVRLLVEHGALPVMAHPTYSAAKSDRDGVSSLPDILSELKAAGLVGDGSLLRRLHTGAGGVAARPRGRLQSHPMRRQRLPRPGQPRRAGTRRCGSSDVQRRCALRPENRGDCVNAVDSALSAIVLTAAAYLWGGIPTAYLAARFAAGIDIRDYGSGNVGASNALVHLGAKTGVAIGLFDLIGKGILPVVIARALDAPTATQVGVALAAIAGHNWSPYIRFTGGRGVGAAGGAILAFALWYEALVAAALIAGIGRFLLRDTGLLTLLAMAALPLTAVAVGALGVADRQTEVVALCAGIALLLAAKRLTANWERPDAAQPVLRTLVCRILWDRDVPKQQEWTKRTPIADTSEATNQ